MAQDIVTLVVGIPLPVLAGVPIKMVELFLFPLVTLISIFVTIRVFKKSRINPFGFSL